MTESHLTVEGIYSNLMVIGELAKTWARQIGFDDRGAYAVQMAVDEACSNIIKHGYGGESKGEISLEFQPLDDGLQVTIRDQGAPFDPKSVPAPDLTAPIEKRDEGGLGLFLMHQLMDEVNFSFGSGGGQTNILVMVKRLQTKDQGP